MKWYGLAVIGDDARSRILRERLRTDGPFALGRLRLLDTGPETSVAQAAGRDDLAAIYLGAAPGDQSEGIATALAAAKMVLIPPAVALAIGQPAALEEASLRGSGRLVIASNLRHALAAQALLAMVRGGELGTLHSIYLATRWQADPDREPQAARLLWLEHLWEAVDLILALAGEALPQRVYATAGPALAGGGIPVMFNARFAADLILTGEIGPTLPQDGPFTDPETDIEVAGGLAAARCEPYRETVFVSPAKTAPALRTWQAQPVINLLESLADELAAGGGDPEPDWTGLARRAAVVAAIEASLASGGAVVP